METCVTVIILELLMGWRKGFLHLYLRIGVVSEHGSCGRTTKAGQGQCDCLCHNRQRNEKKYHAGLDERSLSRTWIEKTLLPFFVLQPYAVLGTG
jgi:hypothetical protein